MHLRRGKRSYLRSKQRLISFDVHGLLVLNSRRTEDDAAALFYLLVFPGPSVHFAPSICMSAFSIRVQQHNEEVWTNMLLGKSILAPYIFRMFINSSQFLPRA